MASLPHVTNGERIGLIAGNGRFPIIFADNARKLGYYVSAVAHIGEAEPELEQHVDRIHWIKIGQLNKLINAFKADGIERAVMLGGVKKTHVFTTVRPDLRADCREDMRLLDTAKHDGSFNAIGLEGVY